MGFGDHIAATDRATQEHLGGVLAIYTPAVGAAVPDVPGMFDENFLLIDPDRPGVEITAPVVTFRLEDLPVDPYDDDPTIQIFGVDYTVDQRITDGTIGGSIRLMLHRVTV